jgi:hypothetical protein
MENLFGITKEEVLNLAAQKAADMAVEDGGENVYDAAMQIVRDRLDKVFGERINAAVDNALSAELEKVLSEKITPVNLWGEKAGNPITLRAAMRDKSAEFWSQTVNSKGEPSSGYGTVPRWEFVMRKFLNTEFDAVIKQNIVEVVGALKASMRADIAAKCNAMLDDLIIVKI